MNINPQRLRTLFSPRTVALVGASDKSVFSEYLHQNLMAFGRESSTFLVNPKRSVVHGRPAYESLRAIPEPVDLAFLMVQQSATLAMLEEAADAGVSSLVIVSSGYGEAGEQGKRDQELLVRRATELDLILLGPNNLGFANFVDGVPMMAVPGLKESAGRIALLSQSGASSRAMMQFAEMTGNPLSHMVTLGNEAMVTAGHVLEYMVDDDSTEAVAIFMETVREPSTFKRAAQAALEKGKPIVVLKAGSSELAARTAAAHTGALVGDDRSIDAMFRDLGIIRVKTIEDLIVTAGLAAHTGPLTGGGLGLVSISGGACDVVADRAEEVGLPLPALSVSTQVAVREVLPEYGTVQNPLDVTGAGANNPEIFTQAISALGNDPAMAAVAVVISVPWESDGYFHAGTATAVGNGMQASPVPTFVMTQTLHPIPPEIQTRLAEHHIHCVVGGLGNAVAALAGIRRWSERRREILEAPPSKPEQLEVSLHRDPVGTWSEHDSRELLRRAGIPVVPAALVNSAAEAVEAASSIGSPVALKIVSADIAHKSDIGGVRLAVSGEAEVATAFEAVMAAGASVRGAVIDGVLVSPMRDSAPELLVGVLRDDVWGPMMAIALGGVYVEVFEDSVLTPLPVAPERASALVKTLRSAPILQGARGGTPADFNELGRIIAGIGDLALKLGDDLESLEVNPLRVNGTQIEALDALATWVRKGSSK